ncbi:MAG TPA: helix-turn-helix domain-containing protein [Candidatus Limnocylindria bacterium]|nr:helix-turn-helix domain-containing protein [Candidatus Limnocylindria bacterium]
MAAPGVAPTMRLVDAIAAPTTRKRQVLELVAAGYATKQIAAELGISDAAVEKHLRQLFRRYGVPNRAALVSAAFRNSHLA